MCARKNLSTNRKNMWLTGEHFKSILDAIPTLKRVTLQGFGEPLLTPGLQELLDIGKGRKIRLVTFTNGSLLHIDRYADLAVQFDDLVVSFDSIDKTTFESIRIGSDFDKIKEGMRKIDQLRKQRENKFVFIINFAASHLNYKDIPQLKEICLEAGIDSVIISELGNWYTPNEAEYAGEVEFVNKTRRISEEIRRNSDVLAASLKPLGKKVFYVGHERRKPVCRWTFDNVFISADGYVTPCCARMNPDVINFGNIYEEKFADIWNNKAMRDFRRSMIENTANPICDNCPN
jgi:radical SAM protein with 4Fe4S-binding SPASM domain